MYFKKSTPNDNSSLIPIKQPPLIFNGVFMHSKAVASLEKTVFTLICIEEKQFYPHHSTK